MFRRARNNRKAYERDRCCERGKASIVIGTDGLVFSNLAFLHAVGPASPANSHLTLTRQARIVRHVTRRIPSGIALPECNGGQSGTLFLFVDYRRVGRSKRRVSPCYITKQHAPVTFNPRHRRHRSANLRPTTLLSWPWTLRLKQISPPEACTLFTKPFSRREFFLDKFGEICIHP